MSSPLTVRSIVEFIGIVLELVTTIFGVPGEIGCWFDFPPNQSLSSFKCKCIRKKTKRKREINMWEMKFFWRRQECSLCSTEKFNKNENREGKKGHGKMQKKGCKC